MERGTMIIVGVVLIIAIALVGFGFRQPQIIRLSETDSGVSCPKAIGESFELDYRNVGNEELNVCVEISPEGISFDEETKCLLIPAGKTMTFQFNVDDSSRPAKSETAVIKIVYSDYYQEDEKILSTTECSYLKTQGTEDISFSKSKMIA